MALLEDLLARSQQAAGGPAWQGVRTLHLEGTISAGGLCGPYEQYVSLADGRFATAYTLGPAPMARGFDGVTAWQRGPTGEVVAQDSEAARKAVATEAYLHARAYWGWDGRQREWPADMAVTQAPEAGFDVLHITPQGGQPVALWVSRATGLIERAMQNVAGKDSAKHHGDHRWAGGVLLPFCISSGGADPRHEVVIQLDRVAVNGEIPEEVFAMPAQRFDDVVFTRHDGGGAACRVPMALVNNHVYLPVTLAGERFNFMLDTGGVNLLTPEAAARAGLQVQGALQGRGPGEASVAVGFTRVDELMIGDDPGDAVLLRRQLLRVMPLPGFSEVEGTPFDGLLGYETLKRLVVRIDYEPQAVSFLPPQGFTPPPGAMTLPLSFYAHLPAVAGVLDGVAGQFWLDTGNRNALTLWAPFVAAHGLAGRYGAGAPTTIGWGVGGPATGCVARAGQLVLGPITVQGPVLTLPAGSDGPTATRHVAGNIGGDLLRRFTVVFDYAHQAVHLLPNTGPAEPFHHDRAGLWINCQGGAFVAKAVLARGPADEAGLQVGDRITAVEGEAATGLALDALRRRLRESAPGTALRLEVARGGAAFEAVLCLRDLVPEATAV